ncbi:MAG: hypothetical protein AB1750_19665, partial [Chloroflexota bacterium]
MSKSKLLVFALTLALLVTAFAGANGANAAPGGQLAVRIGADQATFAAGESALVNVTVSNTGRRPAKILKWHTPYDDVEASLFAITRDGAPVAYLGAFYKRSAPTSADYVTLRPGESFTRTVDLGQYYDLSVTGTYSIRYDFGNLSSNKLDLGLEGRPNPVPASILPDAVTGSTAFNKCAATQQSTLLSARDQASAYAADSFSYLNANKTGPRYTTWFG